jgi:hypothetical protein
MTRIKGAGEDLVTVESPGRARAIERCRVPG